jgi:hypothetical protein
VLVSGILVRILKECLFHLSGLGIHNDGFLLVFL